MNSLTFRVENIVGGIDKHEQWRALSYGVDILIGTPGRMTDLERKKAFSLSHVSIVVIDEADKMLS